MSDSQGVPPEFFDAAYTGTAAWEIGRPQEDIVRLFERGGFRGQVLDVGCGSGDNALFLASKNLQVVGLDRVPAAIARAQAKASERGLAIRFLVADVLDLEKHGATYDTVLDCGVFHVFSDADRARYVQGLAAVTKNRGTLHLLCFSDQEPGTDGPRRIGERELVDQFNMKGWLVEEIAEARYESNRHPDGARAWLATFTRYTR
ncbi:MAG: class I SAM-dependent methyltransferase [Gemmataceae bacterium]